MRSMSAESFYAKPDAPAASARRATFAVHAVKDPNGGNLDRIQIIKIATKNGKSVEKVFDVVWSGDRRPDPKTVIRGDTVRSKGARSQRSESITPTPGSRKVTDVYGETTTDPNPGHFLSGRQCPICSTTVRMGASEIRRSPRKGESISRMM